MLLEFLLSWIIGYVIIYLTMSNDNIWWISDSPEWKDVKKMGAIEYLSYVIKYRLFTVLTASRDVYPAIVSSLGMAVWVSFGLWGWAIGLIISAMVLKVVHLKVYG